MAAFPEPITLTPNPVYVNKSVIISVTIATQKVLATKTHQELAAYKQSELVSSWKEG